MRDSRATGASSPPPRNQRHFRPVHFRSAEGHERIRRGPNCLPPPRDKRPNFTPKPKSPGDNQPPRRISEAPFAISTANYIFNITFSGNPECSTRNTSTSHPRRNRLRHSLLRLLGLVHRHAMHILSTAPSCGRRQFGTTLQRTRARGSGSVLCCIQLLGSR